MSALTAQALFEAAAAGHAVDGALVRRALNQLEACRTEVGAIAYDAESGTGAFSLVPGATVRMLIAETTLRLAGRGSVERVRGALDAFFTHWERLEERRAQTGTHTPPFLIAPYYVFFGHHYAAQAIEQLPPAERPEYRSRLHERLAQVRDADGTWNDRVFPRTANYGTAMVVLALGMPGALGPATWDDGASRPDPLPTK